MGRPRTSLAALISIREAGFRLDHLIRNALDPNRNPDWPRLWQCSAIKAFVEVIEARLSATQFTNPDEVHAFIDPRLDLAREDIRRTDEALAKEDYEPISSDGFRQEVIVHGNQLGLRIEDLVFENPISMAAKNYPSDIGATRQQRELLVAMRFYWT